MKIPKVKAKDLLRVTDFNKSELYEIFKLTEKLKRYQKSGKCHKILKGKTLAMIFEKSSTRTRVSFETGMYQLGGNALFLNSNDIQLGRGETVEDTAKVLSRYVDGIMIRTFSQQDVENLALNADIPIINGLTDDYHPCQAITDFFTIYEREHKLEGLKLAFIGDGNNMAHSLLLCGATLGIDISIATPKSYAPDPEVVKAAISIAGKNGSKIEITTDIEAAASGAHYIYTDVWASMGQEKEMKKREKAFSKYRITKKLLDKCAPEALIMHCLPAHRGEEIDAEVIDSEKSIIFDEAENRLHVQKAIMAILMKK